MTPLAAFQDTLDRARYLLRLHDGLINQRRRRIRADWKLKFTKLMHWPAAAAIERVDTAAAVMVLRQGATLAPDDFTRSSLDELLRSALVLGVSALDRYVHERVTKSIVTALRAAPLNRHQRDFSIPIATAMQIADGVRAARHSTTAIRPANAIRKAVQEAIHKQTYQGWRDVEGAFALIGITGLAGTLQKRHRAHSFTPTKHQLNAIVRRRNEIVHEGDLAVHQRGGGVKRNTIEHAFVVSSLTFLEELVGHLEAI